MKLELKHLAPYLPYGLKIQCGDGRIEQLSTLTQSSLNVEGRGTTYGMFCGIDEIKPILKQISDLNLGELQQIVSYIFRDNFHVNPLMESIRAYRDYITFHDLDTSQLLVAVKPSGKERLPVLNMSNTWEDYEIFFKLHVDMNNLIGKGLAIDINTI